VRQYNLGKSTAVYVPDLSIEEQCRIEIRDALAGKSSLKRARKLIRKATTFSAAQIERIIRSERERIR